MFKIRYLKPLLISVLMSVSVRGWAEVGGNAASDAPSAPAPEPAAPLPPSAAPAAPVSSGSASPSYQVVDVPEKEEPDSPQFAQELAQGMWIKRRREITVTGFDTKLKLFRVQNNKEPARGPYYATSKNLAIAIEFEGDPSKYERKPNLLVNNVYVLRKHLRLVTPTEISAFKKKMK